MPIPHPLGIYQSRFTAHKISLKWNHKSSLKRLTYSICGEGKPYIRRALALRVLAYSIKLAWLKVISWPSPSSTAILLSMSCLNPRSKGWEAFRPVILTIPVRFGRVTVALARFWVMCRFGTLSNSHFSTRICFFDRLIWVRIITFIFSPGFDSHFFAVWKKYLCNWAAEINPPVQI